MPLLVRMAYRSGRRHLDLDLRSCSRRVAEKIGLDAYRLGILYVLLHSSLSMWEAFLNAIEFGPVLRIFQDKCVTEAGSAVVCSLSPQLDEESCENIFRGVRQMTSFLEANGILSLPEPFVMEDVARQVDAEGSLLTLESCHALSLVLKGLVQVHRELRPVREGAFPEIRSLGEGLPDLEGLRREAERLVDEKGEIRTKASPELAACRREVLSNQEQIRSNLKQWMTREQNQSALQDDFITIERDRYVVPIKRERLSRMQGVVHRLSSSGATAFFEPMEMLPLGNRLAALRDRERRIIHELLAQFTKVVRVKREELRAAAQSLVRWDLLQAKARVVKERGWTLPQMSSGEGMHLEGVWHPLLEEGLSGRVVPVSLHLPQDQSVLLVTGPNAGGKTVLLKTVGLIVALAKSGLPLPGRDGCLLPFFKEAYADMGDEQDIVRGESTFASHLRRIVDILSHAAKGSLVVVDELCTGTDPDAAAALGQAILEELAGRDCLVLCTTHLATLAAFVQERDDMTNASMSFDSDHGEPTYELRLGAPGGSHALAVAEKWGLPDEVLVRATELLGEEKVLLENLISQVKERETRLAREERTLARTLEEANQEKSRYRERRKNADKEAREIKAEAKKEAKQLLRQIRGEADRIVGSLRKRTANPVAGKDVTKGLEKLKDRIDEKIFPADQEEKKIDLPLEEGMPVEIRSSGKSGRILELKEDGSAVVQAGSWRLVLPPSELVPAEKKPNPSWTGKISHHIEEIPLCLDLRGMRVYEAETALEGYLDRAILSSFDGVEILHGEGTGALKEMCREMLKRHPSVQHFEMNPQGRMGVTAVRFKGG